MDGFWRLLLLSLSMFFGCYVSGMIPLVLTLSAGVLRKVTTFGAGLLIGTALIVIIPEGMESLFGEALHTHHGHQHTPVHSLEPREAAGAPSHFDAAGLNIDPPFLNNPANNIENFIPDKHHGMRDINSFEEEGQVVKKDSDSEVLSEEGVYTTDQLQFMMGLSLVSGFIFMLLIDQCNGGHSHSHSAVPDVEGGGGGRHNRNRMTATIGLVVHAAADGLALGAAAGLSKADVELIIFLAIMLHKAPAAFGFTSFLIHEGYDKQTAKRHLLAFSLAAPIASFISFFGLVRVMYIVHIPLTGIAMLFSAGTFLYVSTVHVLNEIIQNSHSNTGLESSGQGTSAAQNNTSNSKLSRVELIMLVTGAFLPLLFNAFHSHGH